MHTEGGGWKLQEQDGRPLANPWPNLPFSIQSPIEDKPDLTVSKATSKIIRTSRVCKKQVPVMMNQDAISRAPAVTPGASIRHGVPKPTNEIPPSNNFSPVQSSLGSLYSFLQTRGKRLKREKPGETSPYFGNAAVEPVPEATQVTGAAGGSIPEMITEESHLEYDSLIPNILPRGPPSTTALVLILSASLLQSDRHLIRSLETHSPAPRLIFRDYKIKNPQATRSAGTEEEADISVSPQTGIILTTSQATTQAYLPGHRGVFRSPLQERIARISQRYEQIYVLVRLPTLTIGTIPATDARTMSSILSLYVFCASLAPVCTVIPLLVPADETELTVWICSISGHHGPFPKEDVDVASSSYLDEETRWEVFLRHAGLNAFAAQSVLAVLKSLGGGQGDDGAGVAGLSLFIEMNPAERRALFTEVVGERLLARVEKVLQQNWQ